MKNLSYYLFVAILIGATFQDFAQTIPQTTGPDDLKALTNREYHVSVGGDDSGDGSLQHPFRSISAAARVVQPGDLITVHEGTYREYINPPRGGLSDQKRITYQAAPGEQVNIKGSEIIRNWERIEGDIWKTILPNTFFGAFNPYSDLIAGDWFSPMGREHHTGAVYLNGEWLLEAASLDEVLKPAAGQPLWFGQVGEKVTTLWARFQGADPNRELVEINVRKTIFYPSKNNIDFLTIRGFTMCHAATNWAPPTAEQVGLIGTNWSKGWIIENNDISYSRCSGIALGKHGDEFDNTSANTAEGYVKTIERAHARGWAKGTIGGHIVRNNHISYCEQTGIVGSMGCSFSTITGNEIHDIHVVRHFSGAEMAGIKLHGAIDTEIHGNHIYRTIRGLWLDWMAQGARVTNNLMHDNIAQDIFLEVNHGPFLIANNILLSGQAIDNQSDGGAFAHNLTTGTWIMRSEYGRVTPFMHPHQTAVIDLKVTEVGDIRMYNNLICGEANLTSLDEAKLPVISGGNVYLQNAKPPKKERKPALFPAADPAIKMIKEADGYWLEMNLDPKWFSGKPRKLVNTDLLGITVLSGGAFELPDGSPMAIETDFPGNRRSPENPFPGPIEPGQAGTLRIRVW